MEVTFWKEEDFCPVVGEVLVQFCQVGAFFARDDKAKSEFGHSCMLVEGIEGPLPRPLTRSRRVRVPCGTTGEGSRASEGVRANY